jgi:asparagine synthase (glutamine-hydrolysing)
MCGIAGFLARNSLPTASIVAMTDLIRHRGPDDEGFLLLPDLGGEFQVCGGNDTPEAICRAEMPFRPSCDINSLGDQPVRLALGHRRLSIVDLSAAGHQPMCTPDRRFWIVYNGEVYNHIELKLELIELGYQFRSHSDTEVILAAYQEWGTDCLSRFNGMFAFLLYDSQEMKLFAARDRFGVKPLYYWISPAGDIAFASEIKQFTVLPGWRPIVNGQRAYDYLVWSLTDHTDETMFSGVFQLRQGQCCSLNLSVWQKTMQNGRLPLRQWYDLPVGTYTGGFKEAAAELQHLLIDSVRLRARADVPIGSCLSGGLDSSSIVCILNRLLEEQNSFDLQKTFSACSDIKRFDEREWIDRVVAHTGVDSHHVYPAFEQLFAESPAITWHQDEPFGSTSIYAQWNVFRLAADNGVKVMLDGQGADEALAGYHSFFPPFLTTKFLHGRFFTMLSEMRDINRLHGYSPFELCRFVVGMLLPDTVQFPLKRLMGLDTQGSGHGWLDCELLGAKQENPLHILKGDTCELRQFSRVQLLNSNLPMLLHWEDRDSMAHSVESRLPFLDYRLVEFALSLPDDYKLSGGITKRVLREGMNGVLPEAVRNRMDKLGFVTPEEVWLRNNREEFRRKLQKTIDVSGGIIRPAVLNVFDDVLAGRQPFSFTIWRLLNFGEWMSCFSVNNN